MKHTVATLTALVESMQAELIELRAEVAQLRAVPAPAPQTIPDVELTPLAECPEYPPMDTQYEPTPVPTHAPVANDSLAEYAALHCSIGYIATKRAPAKVKVTYYTARDGHTFKKFSTSRQAVSVDVTNMSQAERDSVTRTLSC